METSPESSMITAISCFSEESRGLLMDSTPSTVDFSLSELSADSGLNLRLAGRSTVAG